MILFFLHKVSILFFQKKIKPHSKHPQKYAEKQKKQRKSWFLLKLYVTLQRFSTTTKIDNEKKLYCHT